ncbi:hypothetical protein MRB53_041933 [Persea americana]|nr:hypothetical protein MRB53_041933 [Persea americana]
MRLPPDLARPPPLQGCLHVNARLDPAVWVGFSMSVGSTLTLMDSYCNVPESLAGPSIYLGPSLHILCHDHPTFAHVTAHGPVKSDLDNVSKAPRWRSVPRAHFTGRQI